MKNVKIAQQVSTLTEAIEAAKSMGNDIFAGYTNCIASQQRINDDMGVKKYYVMSDGRIYYICQFSGQKILNSVKVGSSLTSAPLCLASKDDNGFTFYLATKINKSDQTQRRAACDLGFILTDPSLATARTEYNY